MAQPGARSIRILLAVAGGYVAAQVMADVASLRIVEVAGFAVVPVAMLLL